MFCKKRKQMGAIGLAVIMTMSCVQIPVRAEESNVIQKGENLTLPSVNDGETVRFCADYEQVIGETGEVYTPLEDKTVKGFFEKTASDGTKTKEAEITYTVKGLYGAPEANANAKPAVIPELQEWHGKKGTFLLSAASKVVIASEDLRDTAKEFAQDYLEITGMELKEITVGTKADAAMCDFYFELTTEDKGLDKEGYYMDIDDTVSVEAEDAVGVYYATRTILQILKQSGGSMPKGLIRDYPKYEVRAFMLDVGRKAFSMDSVKQFAKNMSWYKLNSFQVHLNDNLIFIEDHKLSTDEVGSVDQENRLAAAAQSYEGYRLESDKENAETGMKLASEDMHYTKDEFRSLIQDSRKIGINVVPELDMPAHALSFTKTFPEYMSMKDVYNYGQFKYTFDELDLSDAKYDKTIEFAYSIWDEYIGGEDPVFDKDTTIHIGTDEHHGDSPEQFRKFSRDLINHIQESGRTVRMWGSLSNKVGSTPVPSENVQLNIWSTGYANPQNMYNAGFDIINTSCHEGLYIVPRGTGVRGTNYEDYLDTQHVYNNYFPNKFGNVNCTIPAGDDQMLGGCYAIWHDYIDTRANGISEYDSFDRFFEALPYMSAKLWGEASDRDYSDFKEVVSQTGTAPGTTICGDLDYLTSTIADYTFDEKLEQDSSINGFDLKAPVNASLTASGSGKALKLNGGASYVETPDAINMIGDSAALKMRVKMDADAAEGEQILCESKEKFGMENDDTYGTYAFKAVQKRTGKVGFSREGYDYSFNYELPKDGQYHELEFYSGQNTVALYVDGELKDNDPEIYYFNHPERDMSNYLETEDRLAKVCTMLVPFGRIGSRTNSFKGEIDYVTVTGKEKSFAGNDGAIPHSEMTASACSVIPEDKDTPIEGPVNFAIDDDENTYWHTDWSSDTVISDDHHWFKITLSSAKTISKLTYLPRKTNSVGRILRYSIVVDEVQPDGTTTPKTVVENGSWADNDSRKTAEFNPVNVKSVKLKILDSKGDEVGKHGIIAELNLYEPINAKDDLTDYIENTCAGFQKRDYTDESWRALEEAMEQAERILNYSLSAEADYAYAYANLKKAAEDLKRIEDYLPDSTSKDRYQLSSAVLEAEAQIEELEGILAGTSALNKLQAVLKEAKEALKQGTDSVDLSKLLSDLLDAKDMDKIMNAAKLTLTSAITEAKNKLENTKGYTAASVQKLQNAVTAAENLLKKPDPTLKELEEEAENLRKISLEKEADKTTDKTTDAGLKDKDSFEADGMKYQVVSASALTARLVKGKDAAKLTVNTASFGGKTYKVVEIGDKAFNGCRKKLKKVTIGANVTTIGKNAFKGCKKLANVIIQNNSKLSKVGGGAFKKTSSKIKVKLPKNLKKNKKLKNQLKKAGIKKGL